ncbi:uncharacterized protein BYT42DRAFT_510820 [Radiomyces spectabilis]|uniref:uncharacterized protein n=1 Tax=Radiomyces spectabilis TaxID=64574 RepID=UPI00221E7F80|nr:uncharacterized protein BYT42DRAFT_510820 [Radiomyces spectabilis]KAI8388415.1 hypothetical protein BYT42DRAFT_510820 [Radiomyces spectabilis]
MELKSGSTLRRGGGGGRRTARTVNPQIVYDAVLRCAVRVCNELNGNTPSGPKELKKERSSGYLGIDVFGGLSDKFGEESKPDKLTREIVRGMARRLDDISDGKDLTKTEYQDKRFKAVIKQMKKVLQQHRYRPTGTVNDLVIIFLKTSETELKRHDPNPAVWYEDLNRFIARFAELLVITIQEDAPSSASPEVMELLDGFISPRTIPRSSDKKKAASTPGNASPIPSDSIESLENFPMIQTIQKLFDIPNAEHTAKLRELQPLCTESAFLLDLKKLINNVHTNQPYPGRKEDFPTQQAYDSWQKKEVKQLTELMNTIMLMNPKFSLGAGSEMDVGSSNLLSGGGPRAPNRQSSGTDHSGTGQDSVPSPARSESLQNTFTFVPSDPKSFFRYLMDLCIEHDLKTSEGIERAKGSVLSQQSDELLRECWKTWRLSSSFRATLYLELVKTRFDADEVDFDDIQDAIRTLDKVSKESDIEMWPINDRERLVRVFEGLNNTVLHQLADALSEYWRVRPEWISDLVTMLDKIYENPVFLQDHTDPLVEFGNLEEIVEGAAVERWRRLEKNFNNPENSDDLERLVSMADKLLQELVSLAKRKFKTSIKGIISVPSIVMAKQMPYFALEMDNWAFSPAAKDASIEVTFELYHKVLRLKTLYDQHGSRQKAALFKVESWFLQHVRRWLMTTKAATLEWVENAIKEDKFEKTSEAAPHSSSVIDLFSMFHQAVDFLHNLQWPNELQRCGFLTALSKVIGIALEQYTVIMEDMITEDLVPKTGSHGNPAAPSTFLDMARYQLGGGRSSTESDVPTDFTPEFCIKINNIEAARSRLDRLYEMMDADAIAEKMRDFGVPQVEKEQKNFLYSIKIVRAEGLQALDNNGLSDPYVVLEIDEKPITRTRTVYETLNPRWDQVFDIWLTEKAVEVLAIVYDEDMIGADDECGYVHFKLAPEYFSDFQSHEFTLKLHPQGQLVLRVGLEGEKNDIQFWFGKAFRTLRRAENDAAGLIVDKMSRYMRQCMSRKTMDKLLGRDRSFFAAFTRAAKPVSPSIQECEDAIAPLLDYLERNLKVLNDNLWDVNMQFVLDKIWKEMLLALENVLLPPLSEQMSEMKPLDEYEFDIIFKWLELLKILLNGGEEGDGVPLEKLETSQYYALLAIKSAYYMDTDQLMQGYHSVLKNQVEMKLRGGRKMDRSKTVYHSRHTIKKRKSQRKSVSPDLPNSETILRILRMRSGKNVREFLREEYEKRNNVVTQQAMPRSDENDAELPLTTEHVITPSDEQTLPIV